MNQSIRNASLPILACLLVACGGGGGSTGTSSSSSGGSSSGSSSGGASLSLNGTAAVGLPIVDATVSVVCSGLDAVSTTTTDTSGNWHIAIPGASVACALEVSGGTIDGLANTATYHTIATSSGTNNITPLTDLVTASVAGTADLHTWFTGLTGSSTAITTVTPVEVQFAWSSTVGTRLPGIGAAISDPVTVAFSATPGDTIDNALTALGAALTATGVSYPVLLGNMAGNTAPVAGFGSTLSTFYSAITTPATNRGTGSYTVGGTVSGLPANLTMFLWNGNDTLAITGNGNFTFPSTLATGTAYAVNEAVPALAGQSPNTIGVTCTITNGSGTIAAASVTNVAVACSTYHLPSPSTTQYWGALTYDAADNVGAMSYNYQDGGTALTEANLACTGAHGSCQNVAILSYGQCAAIAAAPPSSAGQPYRWGSATVNSTLAGGSANLTGALLDAEAGALANCSAPPVSTAVPVPSSTHATCGLIVASCVNGETAGTVTGGGTSSSSSSSGGGSSSGSSSGGSSSSSSSSGGGSSSSSSSSGGSSSGSSFNPTTLTGSYTGVQVCVAASAAQAGNCTTQSDSGTFGGSLASDPTGFSATYFDVPTMTVTSTLFGSVSQSLASVWAETNLNNYWNTVWAQSGSAVNSGSGPLGIDLADCRNIVWSSGPLAGQGGTVSTGSGQWNESIGFANSPGGYPDVALQVSAGTCTVTVQ